MPDAKPTSTGGRLTVVETTLETHGEILTGMDAKIGKLFSAISDIGKNLTGVSANAGKITWKDLATLVTVLVIGGTCIGLYVNLKLELSEARSEVSQYEMMIETGVLVPVLTKITR